MNNNVNMILLLLQRKTSLVHSKNLLHSVANFYFWGTTSRQFNVLYFTIWKDLNLYDYHDHCEERHFHVSFFKPINTLKEVFNIVGNLKLKKFKNENY